ncbi:hypothetical protein H310_02811 [Aphanomyces invadans]|uniref:Peptidase C1A papain C-terminal domain-containing protein n=1 Tax=Aphanomyces invadans TaxID=157072 RepID=A0A024ULU4_9STRA|nr:hypothetical protein H310_02811 [Aphanomyces invadans]ETW06593.1 hypothetical protein H310_02811 [Aphanomyces invadans]|eukprot:XP_008864668.1 hypothetical protein H310_02811 [Aphanomyces invadans]
MKLIVALVAASAAASKQSVSTLSVDQRDQLRAELAAWRQAFGATAAAEGLLPRATKSMSPLDAEQDALQRFYDNKLAIEEARRNNPEATFDNNHPYALMTQAEFKKFVEGVSLKEGVASVRSLPAADLNTTSVKAATVDWTTGRCINPVRNQGQCGSCWAFSSVARGATAGGRTPP